MIATPCNNLSPDSIATVTAQCDFHSSENCHFEERVEYRHVKKGQRYKCSECRSHDTGADEYFDRKYMEKIDTVEKAYLLGWIAAMKPNSEELGNGTVIMPISKRQLDEMERLQRQQVVYSWWFEITLWNDCIFFVINSMQVWKDVCRYLSCGSIPLLGDERLCWHFIRGYFECSGSIELQPPTCSMPFDETIQRYVTIPSRRWNHVIEFRGTNAVDFLGKIYEERNACHTEHHFNMYMSLLQPRQALFQLPECHIYKTCPEAVLPCKGKTSDVGYDISIIRKEKQLLEHVALYDTGIKVQVQNGMYAEIVPRSSLSKSGYMLANSIGIIDPSYTGRILVALVKIDTNAPEIQFPFRCCQLIFRRQVHCDMVEVAQDFEQTVRSEGGFGSTG